MHIRKTTFVCQFNYKIQSLINDKMIIISETLESWLKSPHLEMLQTQLQQAQTELENNLWK